MKTHLNVPANTAIFYSGPGSYASKALKATRERPYLKGYKMLNRLWKDTSFPNKWQQDDATSTKFFDAASQAMAELVTGKVYVMLPAGQGTTWLKDSVWDRMEWPNMNPAAEVIRINPDDTSHQEVIQKPC